MPTSVNVNFLADEFDMNPSYMSRVFQNKESVTPEKYRAAVPANGGKVRK